MAINSNNDTSITDRIWSSDICVQVLCILKELKVKLMWINQRTEILNSYPLEIQSTYENNTDNLIEEEKKELKKNLTRILIENKVYLIHYMKLL